MSMITVASLGYGGEHLNDILPKIIAELQGLTISGPLAGAAAATPIPVVEGIDIQDTILKVLEFTAGVPSDITATTSIVDLRATATLTLAGVVAGDMVKVNGKTYTAVSFTSSPTNSAIGPYNFAAAGAFNTATPPVWVPDDNTTAANLAKAVMSADSTLTCTSATDVVTLVVRAEGVAGNAYALDVTVSNAHITNTAFAGGSATNAVVCSASTVGNTVLVFWHKKSRLVGQA